MAQELFRDYVHDGETVGVTQVRAGYVSEFSPKLIEWAGLTSQSVIVDAPCGTGDMSSAIEAQGIGRMFYLLDVNKTQLQAAQTKMPENKTTLIQADASDIGRAIPAGVDGILTLNAFDIYVPGKPSYLSGCSELLNKDGRLVFDVATFAIGEESGRFMQAHDQELTRMAAEQGAETRLPKHPDQAQLDTYAEMVGRHGLTLLNTVTVQTRVPVETYNNDTRLIPGRLRPRIVGPTITTDQQRVDLFVSSSKRAAEQTAVSTLTNTRVFFIARKGKN